MKRGGGGDSDKRVVAREKVWIHLSDGTMIDSRFYRDNE